MSYINFRSNHPTRSSIELAEGSNWVAWDAPIHEINDAYRLVSLIAPASGIDPLTFLIDGRGRERFYWAEPRTTANSLTIVGVGIAAEIRVAPVLEPYLDEALPGFRFEEVAGQAGQLFSGAIVRMVDKGREIAGYKSFATHPARPRLFGGFAFQDDFVPDTTWSVFSPAHFVLPHFQLVDTGRETYLTINALVGNAEDIEESFAALEEALFICLSTREKGPLNQPVLTAINYPMTASRWAAMVNAARSEIRTGHLEKVVLSRVCEIRTSDPIDVASTLTYLDNHYGDSYRFIFEPVPNHAFFGATPELLLCKTGEKIETMALAGSIGRGKTSEEDEALSHELLASAKDRSEHQLVVEAIQNKIAGLCVNLSIPSQPDMLRLRNIQHLLTPIAGRLRHPATTILSLIRLLHPTPAMGGVPAEGALAFLREAEPVPRGWYAAPIGWFDSHNDGVFAVGIRSAVTQHARVWLYAGAGIVADSIPEREWAETALKFRPMLGALGVKEAV